LAPLRADFTHIWVWTWLGFKAFLTNRYAYYLSRLRHTVVSYLSIYVSAVCRL